MIVQLGAGGGAEALKDSSFAISGDGDRVNQDGQREHADHQDDRDSEISVAEQAPAFVGEQTVEQGDRHNEVQNQGASVPQLNREVGPQQRFQYPLQRRRRHGSRVIHRLTHGGHSRSIR